MANRERRHLRDAAKAAAEAERITHEAFELVEKFIAAEPNPETLSAEKLIALLRVREVFPESMPDAEVLGILAAILSDFGYNAFKGDTFWKMASESMH